jgi:hypothetical protein
MLLARLTRFIVPLLIHLTLHEPSCTLQLNEPSGDNTFSGQDILHYRKSESDYHCWVG